MHAFFNECWLFSAILLVVLAASSLCAKGTRVQEYFAIKIGIFLVFFIYHLTQFIMDTFLTEESKYLIFMRHMSVKLLDLNCRNAPV